MGEGLKRRIGEGRRWWRSGKLGRSKMMRKETKEASLVK